MDPRCVLQVLCHPLESAETGIAETNKVPETGHSSHKRTVD
jgi:hypothetical protein